MRPWQLHQHTRGELVVLAAGGAAAPAPAGYLIVSLPLPLLLCDRQITSSQ